MVGGIAEIRWMVSRGWKRVLEPRPRHMSRIFIRGLPPIPSISTLLAADPCHASHAASPTDVASIVPGQFASRRGDHQRSLSPTNRIRQRAESFASNRSNVPPPVESSISSQVSISRCKRSIPYHFAPRSSTRLSFQITYPRFEYFSFGATIRPFFPFFPGTVLEITRVATVLHDSFRSRGHATPPLERGTTVDW